MTHNYWDDRNEEQRRRDFEGDVFYEAWRRGLNPDRATDCAMDCYHDGRTPDQCINGYEAHARRQREQRRQEQEQQWPDEQP